MSTDLTAAVRDLVGRFYAEFHEEALTPYLSDEEIAAALQEAQEGFELATGTRAPPGYTHDRPLVIGGRPFVGGEFIPAEALAQATPQERAQVDERDKGGAGHGGEAHTQTDPHQAAADYREKGTKAPAFLSWFGDWTSPDAVKRGLVSRVIDWLTGRPKPVRPTEPSKVTGPRGEPLVVHHGTQASFTAFDPSKVNPEALAGPGFYFSESEDSAREWGAGNAFRPGDAAAPVKVHSCYLNIKKPFDADWHFSNLATKPGFTAKFSYDFISAALGGNKQATEKLKSLGYDGITYDRGGKIPRVWVAFEPNQVKAVDNKGTFDPAQANMYLGTAE